MNRRLFLMSAGAAGLILPTAKLYFLPPRGGWGWSDSRYLQEYIDWHADHRRDCVIPTGAYFLDRGLQARPGLKSFAMDGCHIKYDIAPDDKAAIMHWKECGPAIITNNYFEPVGAMLDRLRREAAYPMSGLVAVRPLT